MTPLTKASNLAKFNAEVKSQTSSAGLKTLLETINKSKVDCDTYGKMTALIAGRALELKATAQTPAEISALSQMTLDTLSFTPAKGLEPGNGDGSKYPTSEKLGFGKDPNKADTSKTFADYGWGKQHYDKEDPFDFRNPFIKSYVPYQPPFHGVSNSG
ncbi:MAG: hypothetical protein M1530_00620 [Candidatus Marsarchaeota archaeon]|nr:hypothetical protein [Candidatus Marsarchaeota archaeon]